MSLCMCRERLMRLEHENKMLKMGSGAGNEDSTTVSSDLLDAANARKNELETEVRYRVETRGDV